MKKMEIVVVGGGELGQELCYLLNKEGHEITLIDQSQQVIDKLIEVLDIQGICGTATNLDTLLEANVDRCDVFISVTNLDEVNIISAILAEKIGARYRIVRSRSGEYTANEDFIREHLGINYVINQDKEAAKEIVTVLDYPAAIHVEKFYHDRIKLLQIRLTAYSPILNWSVAQVRQKLSDIVICLVERGDHVFIPHGDDYLRQDDQIHIIATNEVLSQSAYIAGHKQRANYRSVMIIGGSRINRYLVPLLDKRGIHVKLIEKDLKRAELLADEIDQAEIILGDGTDQRFLREHRIDRHDIVISMTDSDEENLMLSLFAHEEGVKKNITKVNRPKLVRLLNAENLDVIVSPRISVSDAIIRHVRAIPENNSALLGYARLAVDKEIAEAMEFQVSAQDRVTQAPIKDLAIKNHVLLGMIVRQDRLHIPSGDDQLQAGDDVLIFTSCRDVFSLDDILERRERA
ncbi:Trk system potassium transporter TrkA [Aerococcus sp. UMB7834]|uniref:Trk system potassium transporter TrkA n=1 Tax=Aerococcus sp. UMB7834 TaxID=3046342 RepID=UPI00254C4601|nr:Trk system potassium transporter TrkA [Aerococcus sp. UMB7834]MDK6804145.1 Trk system potassium transporter TrkA [Aerococcus sp. UMB7834]